MGRLITAGAMAGIGLWISIQVVERPDAVWYPVPTWLAVVVVAGGPAVAVGTYLTGIPSRIATRNAEFWGGGFVTRLLVAAAFSASAALALGLALVVLLGRR